MVAVVHVCIVLSFKFTSQKSGLTFLESVKVEYL